MTLPSEFSTIKRINTILITSLALIILGGIVVIVGASLEGPAYDRWGPTGTTVALSIAVVGVILFLAGPILNYRAL